LFGTQESDRHVEENFRGASHAVPLSLRERLEGFVVMIISASTTPLRVQPGASAFIERRSAT
jgi:hypothetical protein